MQAAVRPSIHGACASEPVPSPCASAIGHDAYVAQWISFQTPRSDASAEQARRRDGDQHLGRDHAEAEPDRAVRAGKRDHRVRRSDARERIEHRGGDVDREQHEREEAEVPVQRRRHEAWASAGPAPGAEVEMPRITTTVRHTSVMTPAPRVANQSGLGPVEAAADHHDPAAA